MQEYKNFPKYKDSTMLNWNKKQLVEYIHCLLHNWESCAEIRDRLIALNKNLLEENKQLIER